MSGPEPTREPTREPTPSLQRLLATWQAWNSRDVIARAAARAASTGDAERAATLQAMLEAQHAPSATPSATEALAAQRELASRLDGWQWQTVAAARAEGATWDNIAAATATTPDDAELAHTVALERAEQAATAAGLAFDHARYRAPEHDHQPDAAADADTDTAAGETAMTDPTDPSAPAATDIEPHADAAGSAWATPDPTLPPEQLSERELIARAEYCDEIAHTGSPADQVAALRDLDAAWDEAERRAQGHPAVSIPAQVAGYIGLVREDYDHSLAAETAAWRRQLDAALQPVRLDHDDFGANRMIPTAHSLDPERAQADPARASGRYAGRELSLTERADRAQSLAHGAGVDVAGYDPDTDVYTDPATGQVVRLDGAQPEVGDWEQASAIAERDGYVVFDPTVAGGFRPLSAGERETLTGDTRSDQTADAASGRWTAAEHEAYLANRPGDTAPYNPAAEYGDPDWREPAADDEADARTAWLSANTAPAPGWQPRPLTEVEDALQDAQERAVLCDRAHDPDPYAWAEYHRLRALDDLAPIPDRDALDELPRNEHGEPATTAAPARASDGDGDGGDCEGTFIDTQGRWWPSTDAWVLGNADPAKALPSGYPDDPDRLRARLADLRAQLAARDDASATAPSGDDGEQRREQLTRWHEDDRGSAPVEAGDSAENGGDDGDAGDESSGWQR